MSSLSRFARNDSESSISPRGSKLRIRYQYLPSDSTSTIDPKTRSGSLVLGHMCKGSCCEEFNRQRNDNQETSGPVSETSEHKDDDHYTALAVTTSSTTCDVKSQSTTKEDEENDTALAVTSSSTSNVNSQSQNKEVSFDTTLTLMTAGSFQNNVELLKYLGGGTYGLAFTARDKHDPGSDYVVKFMKNNSLSHKEVQLMRKIKGHPNIVNITGAGSNNKYVQVFMQLDGSVTFEQFIKINQPIVTENVMRFFFNQMASAVNYIHNLDIAHFDIKPENMIISENFNIKLIDFGLGKDLALEGHGPFEGSCGTFNFMAPEMLQGEDGLCYPKEADIWSLGATLYICLYGHLPFHYDENDELDIDKSPFYKSKGDNSRELAKLLNGTLNLIVTCRFDIFNVLYHSWCLTEDSSFDRQEFRFELTTVNQAEVASAASDESLDITEEFGDEESSTSSEPLLAEVRIAIPEKKADLSPASLFITTSSTIEEGSHEVKAAITPSHASVSFLTQEPSETSELLFAPRSEVVIKSQEHYPPTPNAVITLPHESVSVLTQEPLETSELLFAPRSEVVIKSQEHYPPTPNAVITLPHESVSVLTQEPLETSELLFAPRSEVVIESQEHYLPMPNAVITLPHESVSVLTQEPLETSELLVAPRSEVVIESQEHYPPTPNAVITLPHESVSVLTQEPLETSELLVGTLSEAVIETVEHNPRTADTNSGKSKLDTILIGSRLLVQGALAIYHGCWLF